MNRKPVCHVAPSGELLGSSDRLPRGDKAIPASQWFPVTDAGSFTDDLSLASRTYLLAAGWIVQSARNEIVT
jgi:hypothetical protein